MAEDPNKIIEHIPLGRGVSVIDVHRDGLVAMEKPFGILSHPNSNEERVKSLLTCHWNRDRERYLWKHEGKAYPFYLLHRLDSPTSGVILGCLNPNLAKILKEQFSRRKVAKSYVAIVAGTSREKRYLWKDFIRRRRVGFRIRADINREGGRPAESHVETMVTKSSQPKLSLLKLRPVTGRTHQLRVQCAQRKLPIVGDTTYGDFYFNRRIQKNFKPSRLFLHASSIHIHWNLKNEEQHFVVQSPTPPEFDDIMNLVF